MNTHFGAVRLIESRELKEARPRPVGKGLASTDRTLTAPRLRVLHCIGSFGGGGAERQLGYLSAELRKSNVDVHLAYVRGGPNLDSVQSSGVHLHQIRCHSNYDPLLLWKLVKLVRKVKPHVIQTWLPQMDILGGLCAVFTGIPFIMTERSVAAAYDHTLREHVRCWIGSRAALVVANSNTGRDYWLPRKSAQLVQTIRNGVSIEEIIRTPPVRLDAYGIAESTEVILFAGRYSPEKNLPILLEAISIVLSERPNVIALFFGEGPLKQQLTETVEHHHMQERVRILDYTTQVWSWMKRASLFVSVSVFEGCPNTILEAAIQSCPLVLSDIPQHREVFCGDTAIFVSRGAAESIARGMLEVLAHPDRTKDRVQRAYEKASVLSVGLMASNYLEAYKIALRQRSVRTVGQEFLL